MRNAARSVVFCLGLLACSACSSRDCRGGAAPNPARFVRADEGSCGSKVFSRHEVSDLSYRKALSPGRFLARLWTLYGPPPPAHDREIFRYGIEDRETGLRFCAYSAQSGPSYGGSEPAARLRPSVEAFEALLAETSPSDCEVTHTVEVEYGGGEARVGYRGGEPFREEVSPLDPSTARTYADCLRIATERARRMRADVSEGWLFNLEGVIPPRFRARGRVYENIVTLGVDEQGLVLTCDEGDGLVLVPVRDGAFVPEPTGVAKLWLDSFRRWRRQAR